MTKASSSNWFRNVFSRVPEWIARERPDESVEIGRIRMVERNVGIPVKVFLVGMLGYYLWGARWFDEVVLLRETFLEVVQLFFFLYVGLNLGAVVLLVGMDRLSSGLIRETALVVCLVDALFLGALTVITGGFDSILFWLFLGLQIRNALSLPQPWRQIPLNLWVAGCYVGAGFGEELKQQLELAMLDPKTQQLLYPAGIETPTEPVVLRVVLLLLMGACCYGVEVLLDKQRRVEEEAREFGQRQRQLESAGRLAAEIAHQLKNPLAIINNAAFTLQRTVKEGKTITQQIRIIRDEVERSDRIITGRA